MLDYWTAVWITLALLAGLLAIGYAASVIFKRRSLFIAVPIGLYSLLLAAIAWLLQGPYSGG